MQSWTVLPFGRPSFPNANCSNGVGFTIDWASVLGAVWANCGPLEYKAAEGVGLCSCMG
jgi:hypothetical protein